MILSLCRAWHNPSKSGLLFRLGALNPETQDRISKIEAEYGDLIGKTSSQGHLKSGTTNEVEEIDELGTVRTVLSCVGALRMIDKDIDMCHCHLAGDDETLKGTASTLLKEFEDCKDSLETELNILLGE